MTSGYGLFRFMTGVAVDGSVARPEVVFEAAHCAQERNRGQEELHFPFKPGRLDIAPRFVLSYQPRLDWHMWFAALLSYSTNNSCGWCTVHLAH